MASTTFNNIESLVLKTYKKLKEEYKKEGKTATQLFKDMVLSYSEQRKQGKTL